MNEKLWRPDGLDLLNVDGFTCGNTLNNRHCTGIICRKCLLDDRNREALKSEQAELRTQQHTYGPSIPCGNCRASGCKGECMDDHKIEPLPNMYGIYIDDHKGRLQIEDRYGFKPLTFPSNANAIDMLGRLNELVSAVNELSRRVAELDGNK